MGERKIAVMSRPEDGDGFGPVRPANSEDILIDGHGHYLDKRYAEIYSSDTTASQTIANGSSYTKLDAYDNNGNSQHITPDATNDKITFTLTGKYKVDCTMSFFCDTNNVVWRVAAFLDDVEQHQCHFMRKISTGADVGSAAFTGFINVTASNLDLDVRARHDYGSDVDIEVTFTNLNAYYLGDS